MSPARQAHRRGQRLTVRLTERFHHDVAAARTALAGVPLGRRHGLLATTFAVVLAIAVWTSSGVLMMSRRTPVRPLAAAAPGEAIARTAPAPAPTSSAPAVTRPSLPEADVNREASRSVATSAGPTLNAARVRAIWGKTDTRSLDRALATLRSTTLALHRCDMQITATDRAVAHCDEVRGEDEDAAPRPRRVAWTIEFHRPDDRWLIDGISTTSSMARAAR